jgi:hypothetical protein
MSPILRGHAIAEIESSGRVKRTFDVLLWTEELSYDGYLALDAIQRLRVYLSIFVPPLVTINFWLLDSHKGTHALLNSQGIPAQTVPAVEPDEETTKLFGADSPAGIAQAAATAAKCDADIIVTEQADWFPYVFDFDKRNVLLGDSKVLLRQCEIFVRGHDITWSFADPMFYAPWGPFIFFSEREALMLGQDFLSLCRAKNVSAEASEYGRSLVYNRIANIFFTRDRLLFYDQQRNVAKRAQWKRQDFVFEIGYYLNLYYVLLYGAFDHIAVVMNGVLNLGMADRDVSATNKTFLKLLEGKSKDMHALFTDADLTVFLDRIGTLRHMTAHRGYIAPAALYEKPEKEPTVAELDEEIRKQGLDAQLKWIPEGPVRETFRENLRFSVRLSMYKLVAENVVFVDGKATRGFIDPLTDTEYNFSKFYTFFEKVLKLCPKVL